MSEKHLYEEDENLNTHDIVAQCSCGWCGGEYSSRREAIRAFNEHVREEVPDDRKKSAEPS